MSEMELRSVGFGQLHAGTFFKIGFISNLFFWGFLGTLFGVLALAGVDVVKWNNAYVYGVGGLFTGLLIGAVFSLFGSIILMLGGALGAMVARRFTEWEFTILVQKPTAETAEAAE
ncbi:MAG: hypothetical protein HWE25_13290 [Alphaproteobacteria bacterium]|nr:hypothetical protein [Alphaproteobacteria bacterium]